MAKTNERESGIDFLSRTQLRGTAFGSRWQSQRPYQVEDVTRSFMAVAWLIETIVALPMAPGGASRGCLDSIRAEDGQGLGTLIEVIELSVKILTKQRGSDWA